MFKKIVKLKGKKITLKKKDLLSLNEELQIRTLGFAIKSLNNLDYPPRSKKILTALKFLNSSKNTNYKLGGCSIISRNNNISVEKSQ